MNFGNEDVILQQIEKVSSLLKPNGRIYWRQNPGQKDHGNEECKSIDFSIGLLIKIMNIL